MRSCNYCIHQTVCRHKVKIVNAVDGIIVPQFGGRNLNWKRVENLVGEICQHYKPDTQALKKE